MPVCARCKEDKSTSEFTKRSASSRGLYSTCRPCVAEGRSTPHARETRRIRYQSKKLSPGFKERQAKISAEWYRRNKDNEQFKENQRKKDLAKWKEKCQTIDPPLIESIRCGDFNETAGSIYFIEAVGSGRIKIGWTKDKLESRLASINTGCPFDIKVLGTCFGTRRAEAAVHHLFATHRLSPSKEWFYDCRSIRQFIKTACRARAALEA